MTRFRLNAKDLALRGLTLVLVVGGAYGVWSASVVQRMFLVNGLPVSVQITLDGKTRGVPPGGKIEITLHRGLHQVRVDGVGGEVLEEGPIDVPSTGGVVAYNVLGTAPLYTESVVYGSGRGGGGTTTTEFHGGRRLVVSPHADFVFTPPPQSISVEKSSSTSSHTRWHFDLWPGGWETTLNALRERGDLASALRVNLGVARADPKATEALQSAARLLQVLRGPEIALAYVRKALEEHPEDFDLHRTHQHLLRRADRFEEARAYYRSYREQHEGSALAAVLLARVEAPEPALELYHEALALEPDNKAARRGLAHLLFDLGRFQECALLFDQVAGNDPDYKYYVDDHVRALLRLGEGAKAVQVASAAVQKTPNEWRLAVLYAELAGTEGLRTPQIAQTYVDGLAQRSRDPEYGVWMRSLAGLPVEPKALQTLKAQGGGAMAWAAELQLAAQKDPAQAWGIVAKARPNALERLAAPVALLLAAEFLRIGDGRTADRLFSTLDEIGMPTEALKAYVTTGSEHPELWRLPADVRAVLDFARARKLSGEGAPNPGLYATATTREGYRGLVGRALKSWPAPEPARNGASLVLRRRPA